MQLLVEASPEIAFHTNKAGDTALHLCAANGHAPCVASLLSHASPSSMIRRQQQQQQRQQQQHQQQQQQGSPFTPTRGGASPGGVSPGGSGGECSVEARRDEMRRDETR